MKKFIGFSLLLAVLALVPTSIFGQKAGNSSKTSQLTNGYSTPIPPSIANLVLQRTAMVTGRDFGQLLKMYRKGDLVIYQVGPGVYQVLEDRDILISVIIDLPEPPKGNQSYVTPR
jgi:hypothetical protein